MKAPDLPLLPFASRDAWEAWLAENQETSKGLWLQLAKKGYGIPSITYPEALEVALCYGWIDGQKGAIDDRYWRQKFTPRGARSVWSRINRDKAIDLEAQGRMQPRGRAEVETAKRDGRWEAAYAGQATITVPDDLQAKLDANPAAREFFAKLDSVNRYAILYRIGAVKKPETRARNIEKFVAMLAEGKKIH
jgi:uncharacterized protein YdeI (YjbR/CyaY-like superfamily)